MLEDLRRMATIGTGVAELTRNRAEQLVKELVERSKENRKELAGFIRKEIENQVSALGLVTKRDVERIERRVARLEAGSKAAPAKKTSSTKRTTKAKATGPSGSS